MKEALLNINFVGDISFNDKGKLKNCEVFDLSDADFVVANLEALVSIGDYNYLKKPRVTTDIKSLDQLKTLGINVVTLAHNHVYDGCLSGFKATIQKLDALNIKYIGAGLSKEEAELPIIIEKNNIKIGCLNYCTQDTNPCLPEDCEVYLNWYSLDKIKKNVIELKEQGCDHVVLLLHWGGDYEGGYFPALSQVNDAKFFADLDVSLVVGHHPHTLQPSMKFSTLPVYFSLGNFIFFDVHHDNQIKKLANRRKRGGVLKVTFSKSNFKDKLYFTRQKKYSIKIRETNIYYSARKIYFGALHRFKIFWSVYSFKFKIINPIYYFVFVKEGGIKKLKLARFNKLKKLMCKK